MVWRRMRRMSRCLLNPLLFEQMVGIASGKFLDRMAMKQDVMTAYECFPVEKIGVMTQTQIAVIFRFFTNPYSGLQQS